MGFFTVIVFPFFLEPIFKIGQMIVVLELKPRVLHMLGKCSAIEVHPQLILFILNFLDIVNLLFKERE